MFYTLNVCIQILVDLRKKSHMYQSISKFFYIIHMGCKKLVKKKFLEARDAKFIEKSSKKAKLIRIDIFRDLIILRKFPNPPLRTSTWYEQRPRFHVCGQ